jgi:hypothetical protein
MAVYVDKAQNQLGRMRMSYLVADTEEELHAMADRIGLRRERFQPKSSPHYDVSRQKRALALRFGAIEVDRKGLVEVLQRNRKQAQQLPDPARQQGQARGREQSL